MEKILGGTLRRGRGCTALQWQQQASENRFGSGSLVHLCPVPLVYSNHMFQKSEKCPTEQDMTPGECLSLAFRGTPEPKGGFIFQKSVKVPTPELRWGSFSRTCERFWKLVPCLTRRNRGEKLQNSGSVFVCWLVCWWDWVYWPNWLDWRVVGWLGAVWFACWFSDWYCSSSLFLLMADCSCCLITRIWPSSSDSSWTRGFRPTLRPGPQSPTPKPRHCVRPCPEAPCPGPNPWPSPRPNRSERPFEVVTMGRCFSSKGRGWGWGRGEGGGGGGRSWEDGRSRSFCISCGRTLRLLQWEDSAGFQDTDWLFPSLHLERQIWREMYFKFLQFCFLPKNVMWESCLSSDWMFTWWILHIRYNRVPTLQVYSLVPWMMYEKLGQNINRKVKWRKMSLNSCVGKFQTLLSRGSHCDS